MPAGAVWLAPGRDKRRFRWERSLGQGQAVVRRGSTVRPAGFACALCGGAGGGLGRAELFGDREVGATAGRRGFSEVRQPGSPRDPSPGEVVLDLGRGGWDRRSALGPRGGSWQEGLRAST